MNRLRRVLQVAVMVAALPSGTAAAQEAPPSPDTVAQVGTVTISKADFDRWFAQAAESMFGRPMELVPPGYDRCVAAKRRQRTAKGWRRLSELALRAQCTRDARSLRRQVMQFLIQAQWVEQEAHLQGIKVSARDVDRLFESQKRLAFPKRGGYERFLRESGADEASIKHRVRLDLLQDRITRRLTTDIRPVTKRDVARYRANHRKKFQGMARAKADRRARGLLVALREQRSLGGFIEGFHKRYRAITWCADGYEIAECGAIAPPS